MRKWPLFLRGKHCQKRIKNWSFLKAEKRQKPKNFARRQSRPGWITWTKQFVFSFTQSWDLYKKCQFWNWQFSSESVNVLKESWSDHYENSTRRCARQFCKKLDLNNGGLLTNQLFPQKTKEWLRSLLMMGFMLCNNVPKAQRQTLKCQVDKHFRRRLHRT